MPLHACPNARPANTRTVFHRADPIVVNSKNGAIGMFAIPAGTEIKLRTIGIMRQKNTVRF